MTADPHASSTNPQFPLIVVVGPTASGKTALAIELAEQYEGEIICADSRTIYKGMDIGTAKPNASERARVPHWGLDLVEPGERFTVADFKQYAGEKIRDIRTRGRMPLLVGGTGLYIDAVMFDYQFGADGDTRQRQELEQMTVQQLQDYCTKNNIRLPQDTENKRRLVRAIERNSAPGKRQSKPISSSIIVGIATDRQLLRERIHLRAEQILTNGVVEEATLLGKKYGWKSEAMTGNIYPLIRLYLEGAITKDELRDKFTTSDWQLVKRQLTWLRRNPHIMWLTRSEAKGYMQEVIAREYKM